MLPNGSYTIEAMNFASNGITGMSGRQTINIQGRFVDGPALILFPMVDSCFREGRIYLPRPDELSEMGITDGRTTIVKGPRRVLLIWISGRLCYEAKSIAPNARRIER